MHSLPCHAVIQRFTFIAKWVYSAVMICTGGKPLKSLRQIGWLQDACVQCLAGTSQSRSVSVACDDVIVTIAYVAFEMRSASSIG